MTNLIDILAIRRRLGRKEWGAPEEVWPNSETFRFVRFDGLARIIVTASDFPPVIDPTGTEWIHASISRPGVIPNYSDMVRMHQAVFDDGYAYEVFAPGSDHINIHEFARHLWGRLDKAPVLPRFGALGSI